MTREEQEILSEFRSLLRSPGWGRLVDIANGQIERREQEILRMDIDTEVEVNELRKLKYERMGMKVLMLIPQSIVDSMEEDKKDAGDVE